MPYFPEDYEKMAVHLSERERVAMEAEREFAERIKILFMKDKLGNVYTGIISHVTSFGFFV
jgi:ribonuclease R